MKAKLV